MSNFFDTCTLGIEDEILEMLDDHLLVAGNTDIYEHEALNKVMSIMESAKLQYNIDYRVVTSHYNDNSGAAVFVAWVEKGTLFTINFDVRFI